MKTTLLTLALTLGSSAHAAIMIQTLNCSVPAKNGHILMGAPAPKLKIVSRSAISGTGTTYSLEFTSLSAHPKTEELSLTVSEEQNAEGWIKLEGENTDVLLKSNHSKAVIEFASGAESTCKPQEII
jgi:hypothetical protein